VSKQNRITWESKGSPFRLMTPAANLRDVLRGHGYTVYDIGNQQHLEHEPPEDHTPYSSTGWPGKALYGVGYAIDIMPPKSGAKSKKDGLPLPTLQQLGARLLSDRKAGLKAISWLKYMNWEPERNNGGPCYQESWKPNYARRTSSDRGHIHLSGVTGMENSTVGADYDPVARLRGDDDMAGEAQKILTIVERIDRRGPGWHLQDQGEITRSNGQTYGWTQQRALLEAILAAVRDQADTETILARIDAVATAEAARDADLRSLVERAASGELAADEVVRLIGERLSAPSGS
jgi:hypothetical protein